MVTCYRRGEFPLCSLRSYPMQLPKLSCSFDVRFIELFNYLLERLLLRVHLHYSESDVVSDGFIENII